MRVMGECRAPGVQHGSKADPRAEVLRVGRDRDQRLGGGFEQDVVKDSLVVVGDVGNRRGQREHNVVVGHGPQLGFALG
jgi:hypothetical protein